MGIEDHRGSLPPSMFAVPLRKGLVVTAVIAALAASVLGFVAGLLVFKRSLMWCRDCGSVLTCSPCTGVARGRQPGRA